MSLSEFVSIVSMFVGHRAIIYMTAIVGTIQIVVLMSVLWRPRDKDVAKEVRMRTARNHYKSGVVTAFSN